MYGTGYGIHYARYGTGSHRKEGTRSALVCLPCDYGSRFMKTKRRYRKGRVLIQNIVNADVMYHT